MAKLLSFPGSRILKKSELESPKLMVEGKESGLKKAERAKLLIHQAALLLSQANASQRRIGWLLEDCADMLSVELYGRTLGRKSKNASKLPQNGKNGKSKFKPEIIYLTNSR